MKRSWKSDLKVKPRHRKLFPFVYTSMRLLRSSGCFEDHTHPARSEDIRSGPDLYLIDRETIWERTGIEKEKKIDFFRISPNHGIELLEAAGHTKVETGQFHPKTIVSAGTVYPVNSDKLLSLRRKDNVMTPHKKEWIRQLLLGSIKLEKDEIGIC